MKRCETPDTTFIELYCEGISTETIARWTGWSYQTILCRLKEFGVPIRSRSVAAKLSHPDYGTSRSTWGRRARRVWERDVGPVPRSMHLHHKNHDRADNRTENLELLTAQEHGSRHPGIRKEVR
jgi:hypothetical protein